MPLSGTFIQRKSIFPTVPQVSRAPPQNLFIDLPMRFAPIHDESQSYQLKLEQHRMGHLKTLAYEGIKSSINRLEPFELVKEACNVDTSR